MKIDYSLIDAEEALANKQPKIVIDYSGIENQGGKANQTNQAMQSIDYSGLESEPFNTMAISHVKTPVPIAPQDTRKIWHPEQEKASQQWQRQIKPKTPAEIAKMFAGGFASGVSGTTGSAIKGLGTLVDTPRRIAEYLGMDKETSDFMFKPDTAIAKSLSEIGASLEEGAKIVGGENNPITFLTNTAGSVASFFLPATALTKAGTAPKYVEILMTTAEALSEASNARDRRIEIAKKNGSLTPEADAEGAFWTSLILNEGLIHGTNRLAYFSNNLSLPKSLAMESIQEPMQTGISDISVRELSKPEEYGLSALGGLVGGGIGHVTVGLAYKQQQAKQQAKQAMAMPESVANIYQDAYINARKANNDEHKADQIATATLLETEEGQEYARNLIEATKANLETYAETGKIKNNIVEKEIDKKIDNIIKNDNDSADEILEMEIPLNDESIDDYLDNETVYALKNDNADKDNPVASISTDSLKNTMKRLGLNPEDSFVHIVKNIGDLPLNIRARAELASENGVVLEGLYDKKSGDVYYLADNISPDRINEVIKHELIHRAEKHTNAFESLFGDNAESVREQLSNRYFSEVAEKMSEGLSIDDAFSEMLADKTELEQKAIEDSSLRFYIKSLIAKFRLYLRRKGFNLEWSDYDVIALLNRMVKEGVKQGSRNTNAQSGILASEANPSELSKSSGHENLSDFASFSDFFAKRQEEYQPAGLEQPLNINDILTKDYDQLNDAERNFLNNAMDDYLESKRDIKRDINRITGVRKVSELVREDTALKAGLRKAVIAARQAYKQGRLEGVEVERAKIKDMIEQARLKQANAMTPKSKTPSIKARINEAVSKTKVSNLVREDVALAEALRQAEKAAKTAYRLGHKEGVAKEKEKIKAIIDRAKAKKLEAKLDEQIKYLARIRPTIALPFQRKIIELTKNINLKSNSLKPVFYKNLMDTLDSISNPEDIGMTQETLDSLKEKTARAISRMKKYAFNPDGTPKKTLASIPIEEKKELADILKRLQSQGKFIRRVEIQNKAQEREILLDKLINSTVNLDKPKPAKQTKGDRKLNKKTIKESISELNLKTLDAFRAADRIDGFKENGMNKQFVIEHFLTSRDAEYLSHIESGAILEKLKSIKEEWTDEELIRITLIGAKRMGGQTQAELLAKTYGINIDIIPTPEENRFLEVLKEYYDSKVNDYAATYEARENKPFPKRDVYYFPFFYESDSIRVLNEDYVRRDIMRTSKTESGSTIERKEDVNMLLRTDLLNVVMESVEQVNWYIHMQPLLDTHASVLFSGEFKAHAGDIVYNWWKDEIDKVARHGQMAGRVKMPRLASAFKGARINLSKAIIAYKVSSTLVQFLSVFNGMAYAISKGMVKPAFTMPFNLLREFVRIGDSEITKASKELQLRQAGEFAYAELIKTMESRFAKGGFHFVKRFDLKTAAAVQKSFMDAIHGKSPDAKNTAELYTALSQGSTNIGLMPQVLATGELAKTLLTFENFTLYTWNMISNDFIHKGLIKGNYKRKIAALSALLIMAIAQSLTDKLQKVIWESVSGRTIPEAKSTTRKILALLPSYIPLFGRTISSYIETGYAQTPTPAIGRAIGQAWNGMAKVFKGDELAEIIQGASKIVESILSVGFGIPGTAQIFDILERILPKTEYQKKKEAKSIEREANIEAYGLEEIERLDEEKKEGQFKTAP